MMTRRESQFTSPAGRCWKIDGSYQCDYDVIAGTITIRWCKHKQLKDLNFLEYYEYFSLNIYKRCFAVSPFDKGSWRAFWCRMEVIYELLNNLANKTIERSVLHEVFQYMQNLPALFRSLCILYLFNYRAITYQLANKNWNEVDALSIFRERFNDDCLTECKKVLEKFLSFCKDQNIKGELTKLLKST